MAQASGNEEKEVDGIDSHNKDNNDINNDESKSKENNTKNSNAQHSNSRRRRGSIDAAMTLDEWLEKNNFEIWKEHMKTYLGVETISDTRTLTEDDLKEFFMALKNDKQEILDKVSLHEKISFKKKILKLAESYSSLVRRQSMNEIANSIQFLLTSNENISNNNNNNGENGDSSTNNGNNKLPPGKIKIAKEGIVLQISNNCCFTCFFSSCESSLMVDWPNKTISSLLSEISLVSLLLFLKMSKFVAGHVTKM